ncbi:flagellar hook-basal body complex protein [Clostridium drakei]|uniref:Flagellar hook protein FlgE n=1 Tax=Clostridium drakei TaxID=332101 RepID=A0A2U8DNC6_9CLOT|nr:flagellar hook-basal body complex protein [Clostridium drakei]AWI03714.1 flagellar biosynthesis protein FlgE [Clostridium drakei]
MLPSMFSGISGLKVNQRKLDVIGNNIANSGTTAYKSQRARFQDMVSQSMASATGASANLGGTNPRQVGLGVQLAGIDTTTSTGSMQPTSRPLDAAIDGPGYFIVGTGIPPEGSDSSNTDTGTIGIPDLATHSMSSNGVTTSFTRDGSFTLDTQGSLLTSDGLRVYGYANSNVTIDYKEGKDNPKMPFKATIDTDNGHGGADTSISNDKLIPLIIPESVTIGDKISRVQSYAIGVDGTITATLDTGGTAVLGQIAMASFKNDAGLTKMGKNLYQTSPNSGEPVVRSAAGDKDNDNSKGYGDMRQGMLEMSNVDLAEEFTNMIIANRAFQANGKIITTGDEILQDLVNLKR